MRPKGYWNFETLKAEALKYSTRRDFQLKSGSAYNAAGKLKIRDAVCSHMVNVKKTNGYWNFETCQQEALKFESRQLFQKGNAAAYKAAGELNIRDVICSHMVEVKKPKDFWTLDNLKLEALKYENKVDFRKKSNPAFLTASRKKILDQICSHMEAGKLPNGYWMIKENCATEALKYMNRRAFSLANSSAYHGADINGWLDEICEHMDFNPSSDSDVIYIWKAIGQTFNGLQVYKFGITSSRLDDKRINEVAKKANMKFEVILLAKVSINAVEIETQLLKLGFNPKYVGFNGSSEFRSLTIEALDSAIKLIKKYQVN